MRSKQRESVIDSVFEDLYEVIPELRSASSSDFYGAHSPGSCSLDTDMSSQFSDEGFFQNEFGESCCSCVWSECEEAFPLSSPGDDYDLLSQRPQYPENNSYTYSSREEIARHWVAAQLMGSADHYENYQNMEYTPPPTAQDVEFKYENQEYRNNLQSSCQYAEMYCTERPTMPEYDSSINDHSLPDLDRIDNWIDENILQLQLEDTNPTNSSKYLCKEERIPDALDIDKTWHRNQTNMYENTPNMVRDNDYWMNSWEPEIPELLQTAEQSLSYSPAASGSAESYCETPTSCLHQNKERKYKPIQRDVIEKRVLVPAPDKKFPTTFKHGRPRLCQFLYELLSLPEKYSCVVEWLDEEKGIFKFVNSSEVAQMWGRRRNKPNMKYENFARSLRTYISKGILLKPRNKLVYRFADDTRKNLTKPVVS